MFFSTCKILFKCKEIFEVQLQLQYISIFNSNLSTYIYNTDNRTNEISLYLLTFRKIFLNYTILKCQHKYISSNKYCICLNHLKIVLFSSSNFSVKKLKKIIHLMSNKHPRNLQRFVRFPAMPAHDVISARCVRRC